jgi:hypothetical protein
VVLGAQNTVCTSTYSKWPLLCNIGIHNTPDGIMSAVQVIMPKKWIKPTTGGKVTWKICKLMVSIFEIYHILK